MPQRGVTMAEKEKQILTSCTFNCGARCLLAVQVKNNRVTRISCGRRESPPGTQPFRDCPRVPALKERLEHPDRLKYPLKRAGRRGEGKFTRISWEEATSLIAAELQRITETHGPEARYVHYGSGINGILAEGEFFRRLLASSGGYLNYYGSYSTACTNIATPYTYGTNKTGSSRESWLHSRLILLWGHNPAETSFGSDTLAYLQRARQGGARIIVIDPRYSDSAARLADQWIPLLPTTDNALMDAMIYVLVKENLYDKDFVEKYCLGFAENQMPPGVPAGQSLTSYVLGEVDGIAKTPRWAEKITRVPAATIHQLAREYATRKPAALLQGWGPQRHACGEQAARGATVLAAITGNVGILGGWASGSGHYVAAQWPTLPYENPVQTAIPVFSWIQAVADGQEMTSADGIRHAGGLTSGIKFLACLAGNALINQHSEINRTKALLADENNCQFILVSDEFMTSSAIYADLLLPSTNFLERIDLVAPWDQEYLIFQNQAVEARYERRTGYDWIREVAEKLGVEEAFARGRSYEGWARYLVQRCREADPAFPAYEEFSRRGFYRKETHRPYVAFQEQIQDLDNHPFPTPSGRIEIFSPRLFALRKPREIPAIPRYIPCWEGPEDPLKERYPLQLIGWHSKRSVHSTLANSERLARAVPHALWIHPADAGPRGLADGDRVRVLNDRGTLEIQARVTTRIIPGVVAMPQGAWYQPDDKGVDRGGCINTLTKDHPTPLARGNPQHTNLVQVEKVESGGQKSS